MMTVYLVVETGVIPFSVLSLILLKWKPDCIKMHFGSTLQKCEKLENMQYDSQCTKMYDSKYTLKKISARKILYLYVAPRTFTSEFCSVTYLYSVDTDPCVIGQEHEDTYLYRCRLRHLCTWGEGGVSSAFSEIFFKFIFLTKTWTKSKAGFVGVMGYTFK
jgi:hypothetical protein